jgi:plasmid maintenance system antidote protein VapI
VNDRISNGDFTERGLARMLRVSQSQIHNVLKGARKLTPEMADRVLLCFGINVLDLLDSSELKSQQSRRDGDGRTAIPPQTGVGAHVAIQRFAPEPEIPKKRAGRQSSPEEHDVTKTA